MLKRMFSVYLPASALVLGMLYFLFKVYVAWQKGLLP